MNSTQLATNDEDEHLEFVKSTIGRTPVIFVMNKIDSYNLEEEDVIATIGRQIEYLKKKADEGESFIVVGRCAETVLGDRPNVISLFVLGDREVKCKRVMEVYDLSERDAQFKMERHDKYRKQYHNYYCKDKWGDSRAYDLCINSSRLGFDETVNETGSAPVATSPQKREKKDCLQGWHTAFDGM